MALVQEHDKIASHPSPSAYISSLRFRGRIAAFTRLMVAGMVASKDYRHLNAMTDEQLRTMGLSRSDISEEISRRHFPQAHRGRQA